MRYLTIAAALFALWTITPALAVSLNPITAVKDMLESAVEDRKAGDIATDLEIKTKILARFSDNMGEDVTSINADVYEQDVLVTGIVETAAKKAEAGRLAATVEGVKKSYNEIRIIKKLDRRKGSVEGYVDDNVIEGKINAALLDAPGVNVTNFRWRSVEGHIFVFGRALSREEQRKALKIMRKTEGVRKITDRSKIRPK